MIILYYCSLSKADSVVFSQFWNVLLLFYCIMFNIRLSFTVGVFLGRQCGFQPVLYCFAGGFWYHVEYKIVIYFHCLSKVDIVAFSQVWSVKLLFFGVMLSIGSSISIPVYLRETVWPSAKSGINCSGFLVSF